MLSDLAVLALDGNKLTQLPKEICKLNDLAILCIDNNSNIILTQEQKEWTTALKENYCYIDIYK